MTNLDRWHLANRLHRGNKPAPIHPRGSMSCVGRCGAIIAANRKPPLCRACKLLFDAQVLVDTARVEAERAAAALEHDAGGAALGTSGSDPHPPAGAP